MSKTWIVLRTHDGEMLTQIDKAIRWELVRTANSIGWWTVILSADFDRRFLGVDRLVEFWREPTGGHESLLGVGFMRYWEWFEDRKGAEYIRCGGPDQIGLLNRRIVANAAGTVYTQKTDYADDMMKAIVDEQYISTANRVGDIYYTRSSAISADHFEVAPDESKGKELTKEFAWRRVYDVLKELAEASAWPTSSGDDSFPIYFENVYVAPAKFVFRTYANQLGIDRTATAGIAPIIFSKEAGNLANPSLRWEYTDEVNLCYGGGQGQGAARMIDPENDPPRHNLTVWNYQESFKDARECEVILCVAQAARVEMQSKRPFVEFNGDLLDTPKTRFGVDWDFGDKVTIRYQGFSFDGLVESFKLAVDEDGREILDASVRIFQAIEGRPG